MVTKLALSNRCLSSATHTRTVPGSSRMLYGRRLKIDVFLVLQWWICNHTLARYPVARECCKGDDSSQWRNPKFDPPPRSNPISDSHKSWQRWLRRGPVHLCKSSSRSAQGFRFRACVTLRTKSVYSASFFPVFGGVLATRYSQGP